MSLTSRQTRHLRGLAHALKPVVQVGGRGVSAEIVSKVKAELENHELIKVRVNDADRDEVRDVAEALELAAEAAVAQIIGKTVVLYKARGKKPTIVLPA